MDLDLIERLMRLLEASSLDELDVTEDGVRVRLVKASKGAPAQSQANATVPGENAELLTANLSEPDDRHLILAGLAGTFYRKPLPDAPPFVAAGDLVAEGEKLAIVEAMKMMNPVEADCNGRITEILAEDGAPVVAGTPLFAIEKIP